MAAVVLHVDGTNPAASADHASCKLLAAYRESQVTLLARHQFCTHHKSGAVHTDTCCCLIRKDCPTCHDTRFMLHVKDTTPPDPVPPDDPVALMWAARAIRLRIHNHICPLRTNVVTAVPAIMAVLAAQCPCQPVHKSCLSHSPAMIENAPHQSISSFSDMYCGGNSVLCTHAADDDGHTVGYTIRSSQRVVS